MIQVFEYDQQYGLTFRNSHYTLETAIASLELKELKSTETLLVELGSIFGAVNDSVTKCVGGFQNLTNKTFGNEHNC